MKNRLKKLIEMHKRARSEKSKTRLRQEINREIIAGTGLNTEWHNRGSEGRINSN